MVRFYTAEYISSQNPGNWASWLLSKLCPMSWHVGFQFTKIFYGVNKKSPGYDLATFSCDRTQKFWWFFAKKFTWPLRQCFVSFKLFLSCHLVLLVIIVLNDNIEKTIDNISSFFPIRIIGRRQLEIQNFSRLFGKISKLPLPDYVFKTTCFPTTNFQTTFL